jgi:alkanesulfonate monooxygenase SsuD/methylene tetrahydromethanopterin reductase-like flavin-dependent oxidoreductase (luciferase family)
VARELRFGICTDQNLPWPTLVERWRLFEELGFDSVWVCDHLNQPSCPTNPYYEGWTALAGLAATTRRIRIGVLVTCNTFRHPAVLAQQAITVDHISRGRLEIGLGAGWYVPEHEQFGIPLPPPGARVSRFREAVTLIDLLLRGEAVTYTGQHYQVKDAQLRPASIQRPRPPLMLAAHKPRMLRICAEYADTWNSTGNPDEMRERNRILDDYCAAIGRDPTALSRSFYGWTAKIGRDPWSNVDAFERLVERYREAGVNEFIIDQPDPRQFAVVEEVAATVLPRYRSTPDSG